MAKVKIVLSCLAVLILFSILYFLFSIRKWDGKSRFTLIEVSEAVKVLSFDPQTSRGVEIVLPANLEVETVGGRGKLSASSLHQAGPARWAAASVAHYLGIIGQIERSQLSLVDKWRWWWGARQVQWQRLDLEAAGWVEPFTASDGTGLLRLAPTWDKAAQQLFISLAVAGEKLAVKVVNTTSEPGLASTAARKIESSGMKVVEVSTEIQDVDQCLVFAPSTLRRAVGVKLLVRGFGCQLKEGAELTLWLGRQYQDLVTGNH